MTEHMFRVVVYFFDSQAGDMIELHGTDCKTVCSVPNTPAGRTVLREQLARIFDLEIDRALKGGI